MERARLHRKIADVDLALAKLETSEQTPTAVGSRPASITDVVELAIAGADLRATRRAG